MQFLLLLSNFSLFIKRRWFVLADVKVVEDDGYGADSEAVKDLVSDLNSQLAEEEEGYLAEKIIQEQVIMDQEISRCVSRLLGSYSAPPNIVC